MTNPSSFTDRTPAAQSNPTVLMPLEQVAKHQQVRVVRIDDPQTAMVALRLGIAEGEVLTVSNKVPGGPLVVRRGKVDIALGRALCRSVFVTPV